MTARPAPRHAILASAIALALLLPGCFGATNEKGDNSSGGLVETKGKSSGDGGTGGNRPGRPEPGPGGTGVESSTGVSSGPK